MEVEWSPVIVLAKKVITLLLEIESQSPMKRPVQLLSELS